MFSIRRILFALMVCANLTYWFLHYPFDGWTYDQFITHLSDGRALPCSEAERATRRAMYDDINRSYEPGRRISEQDIEDSLRNCQGSSGRWETLPFSQWRSESPLVGWFGAVQHVALATGFTLLLWICLHLTFRPRQEA